MVHRSGVEKCALAAILFGAAIPAASLVADDMEPLVLAGLLYLGAALAVSPWWIVRRPRRSALRQQWALLALAIVAGGAVGPALLTADGSALEEMTRLADDLRREVVGDDVTYVVNRNINFSNVCYVGCRFCAFAQRERDADVLQPGHAPLGANGRGSRPAKGFWPAGQAARGRS